jgi:hypothetical protein
MDDLLVELRKDSVFTPEQEENMMLSAKMFQGVSAEQ